MVIECGDLNTHLGKEAASYTYHEKTNKNRTLLLVHINASNLLVTNTKFTKKKWKAMEIISDMNNS